MLPSWQWNILVVFKGYRSSIEYKKNLKEGRLREFGCEIATYQLA